MRKIYLLLTILILSIWRIHGQDCNMSYLSVADEIAQTNKLNQIKQNLPQASPNATITYIPIRPNIVRQTNGTGGLSTNDLNINIAKANAFFLGSDIQFYFCGTSPNYINNTNLSNESTLSVNDVSNAINLYVTENLSYCGYAYYPSSNNVKSTNRVFMLKDCMMGDYFQTLSHELGHYFNLIHTHGGVNGVLTSELVNGSNCSTSGDRVCDTPADPQGDVNGFSSCMFSPGSGLATTDANGQAYSPSTRNLMSYYSLCRNIFTNGQFLRQKDGLLLRQSPASNVSDRYTLDCPGTVLTAPSSVTASINGTNATISWTDNSTTEMGFIIERSTSSTTGFVAVGGVAPNVTSFVDNSVMAGTGYFYRVKASNTTTNYSNVASTGGAPCPATLTLTASISANSQVFQASNSITSTSQISGTGTNITYRAASRIVLNQGFKVSTGALFKGRISACNVSNRQASETALYINEEIEGIELSAYPNPTSNGEVIIQYTLPEDGNASINLANMSGVNVKNIVEDKFHEKGTYKVKASVSDLKTGIYLYILQGDKVRLAKKLIVE